MLAWVQGAVSAGAGVSLQLAEELFAEGQWAVARTEGLRAQDEEEGEGAARARVLAATAALRLGTARKAALADLGGIWRDEAASMETRCAAAYELGRAEWGGGDRTEAVEPLKFAYLNARAAPLFWRAGCSLYFLLKSDRKLRKEEAALWRSLQSCRDAWPGEVWRECRPGKNGGTSWASLPGRGVVKFYRSQVGPAIGSRCDLQPSCSEYFLRASRAHGLLGLPIMADRFVREPSVVAAKEKPVVMPDGRIRFADPLADHDGWWTEGDE